MDVFSCTKCITAMHCGWYTPLEWQSLLTCSLSPPRVDCTKFTSVFQTNGTTFKMAAGIPPRASAEGKSRRSLHSCNGQQLPLHFNEEEGKTYSLPVANWSHLIACYHKALWCPASNISVNTEFIVYPCRTADKIQAAEKQECCLAADNKVFDKILNNVQFVECRY